MLNILRIVVDSKNNTNANIIYTYENEKYQLSIHSENNLSYIIDAITIFTNEVGFGRGRENGASIRGGRNPPGGAEIG